MAIPSRQIGWSTQSNLLWQISKELERLIKVTAPNKIKNLISLFKLRVGFNDGVFEAETCLNATLTNIDNLGLLDKSSLIITPNAYNPGVLYDVVPNSNLGDMDVVRATTATRVNSLGLIETVGLNIPRLDYSNGSCPTLLVEPQRTNLYVPSIPSNFFNGTYILNTEISPDGTQNASSFVPSGFGGVWSNAFSTTIQDYTWSVYLKGTVNGQKVRLSTDTATLSELVLTTSWKRYIITFTGINVAQGYYILSGDYYLPSENNKFYIWGSQVEAGSYPTSYIPTVASTVTRNADVISKTGISSLIGQTEGVFYFENIVNVKNLSSVVTIQSLSNDTNSDFIALYIINNAIYSDIQVNNIYSGGLYLGAISSLSLGDTYKLAIKYSPLGIKTYNNGTLTDTSSIIIGNYSKLSFKYVYGDSYIGNKSTLIYKTALTDQECINLTTL